MGRTRSEPRHCGSRCAPTWKRVWTHSSGTVSLRTKKPSTSTRMSTGRTTCEYRPYFHLFSVRKSGLFAITLDYKIMQVFALSRSAPMPFGCGGDPLFEWAKPAHSPNINVLGAVCGTGQKLPLHILDGAFNQWRYHDWLSQDAVPWLQANLPGGLNNPTRQLRYQHDGHRSHTTGRVRKLAIIMKLTSYYLGKSHSTDHQVPWRGL